MKQSIVTFALLSILATSFGSVRMGSGIMTFDTVTGWGLGADGKSVLGPTHGSVVIDKAGNIYTSAIKGVVVFNPAGEVIRTFIDEEHSSIHDMEIRDEDGIEYIYGARNKAGFGIKFETISGKIVLEIGLNNESGLALTGLKPTAITVAPNGDIFLSDGYASNIIFRYDKNGKYLSHFGKKGDGLKEFHTPHGMTLDTRYDPPRLHKAWSSIVSQVSENPKARRGSVTFIKAFFTVIMVYTQYRKYGVLPSIRTVGLYPADFLRFFLLGNYLISSIFAITT